MFRLSKMTDYAVILLAYMSRQGGLVVTAPELSEKTLLPQPAVAKILKSLVRANVLVSKRGAQGGYLMERKASMISIAEVIVAMDGPVSLTACVESAVEECSAATLCPMHGRWQPINNAVEAALSAISLAELIPPPLDRVDPYQLHRNSSSHPLQKWYHEADEQSSNKASVKENV